jgi:hypothetical protein
MADFKIGDSVPPDHVPASADELSKLNWRFNRPSRRYVGGDVPVVSTGTNRSKGKRPPSERRARAKAAGHQHTPAKKKGKGGNNKKGGAK